MELRISETGIRDDDLITSSSTGKQNKGAVIKIRGFYPPNKDRVNKLKEIELRDQLNIIPFFRPMSVKERKQWLLDHSTSVSDVYLDDVGVSLKFIQLGHKNFFTKQLGTDGVDKLIQGNPDDPEGYWPIDQVYNMFPKKPGSRARKTTLIFRPGNWSILVENLTVSKYTGYYIDLTEHYYGEGTIEASEKNEGKRIYEFPLPDNLISSIAIVVDDIRLSDSA